MTPDGTVPAPGASPRRHTTSPGQHRNRQRLQEHQFPHNAVPAALQSRTARTTTHRESLHPDRRTGLQDFRIGDARIGHVGVDRGRTGRIHRGAPAPADGLVVPEAGIAEQHIVHGSLRIGGNPQRIHQRLRHLLADLGVAAHHRRAVPRIFGKIRIQERSFGNTDVHRGE